ncbi:MAG: hypothetical protein HZC17_04925 [Candidatus Omnitrophica bacterium]|nr:hypothetical protein [Candidatus Omnitrophota bacterium]
MAQKNQSEFDDLSFDKQKELFFKSSYADRGDLLLRSQDPTQLANAMSSEEMYLVTRDMDMDMRSEVLKFANLPQLFFMSDLDCWKKDRIDKKGFLDWLKCLEQADLERLAVWLEKMDYEMIVAGFKQVIEVLKPEWEYAADELLGDKPYFTLDGLYYISTTEDNFETIKLAIEVLYQNARSEYVNIMEGLLSEMEYEMEEDAYRRRQIRLSDRGFPELDSALQIYRKLNHEEFEKLSKKKNSTTEKEFSKDLPQYPVLASAERLFLDDVLLTLSKESVEMLHSIQEELIWLSNKVLASEGINLASEEKVRHAIERVRCFVSIGLEAESNLEVARAQVLVKEYWLEFLFRRGFTQLIELRNQLEEIIRKHWGKSERQCLDFLGEPYEAVCRGILKQVPEIADKEFKTLDEIKDMEKLLGVLDRFFVVMSHQNKTIFHVLAVEADRQEESTTLTQLVGTLLAQFVLTGKSAYRPVSKKELAKFFEMGFETAEKKYHLRRDLIVNFLGGLMNGRKDADLEAFLYQVLARIEEDFSGLSGKKAIDPRYINTVRIQ